jgi:tRNA (mo5U34)-methyltransferase
MDHVASGTRFSREELQKMAGSVEFWWHSIDLGEGVVTPGEKTPQVLARELESLRLPDLRGKSVLDMGAYDGFYSFEAERRGAARVVALDHYVWSLDLPGHIRYWRECRERGTEPLPNEQTPHWRPDELPGKGGYDTAHRALRSRVETVVGDFMSMDLEALGTFDLVLFLGVLYHMEDPLGAMRRVASLTREVAIIETHAVVVPGCEHLELCEFYSSNQLNGDVSNWWGFNRKALLGLCGAAGFRSAEVVSPASTAAAPPAGRPGRVRRAVSRAIHGVSGLVRPQPPAQPQYLRAVVHAWK